MFRLQIFKKTDKNQRLAEKSTYDLTPPIDFHYSIGELIDATSNSKYLWIVTDDGSVGTMGS